MDQSGDVTALKAALELPEPNEAALRDAVYETVRTMKAAGRPIEAVIVLLKTTARDAGVPTRLHPVSPPLATSVDVLLQNVVGWCITQYFGEESETAPTALVDPTTKNTAM